MVGDTVGDMVGESVGDTVGEIVGDTVGDVVGEMVGDTVGDIVGDWVKQHVVLHSFIIVGEPQRPASRLCLQKVESSLSGICLCLS